MNKHKVLKTAEESMIRTNENVEPIAIWQLLNVQFVYDSL